jgi:SAM-dependent methyltransferase
MNSQVESPQFYVDPSAPHLGGYIIGGDGATQFPELWAWLVEQQGIGSVLDIGCGEGHALRDFRDLGCYVVGVDGVPQPDPDIHLHDYTTGPWMEQIGLEFDLVWSCEFVEHVEERYVSNFLVNFQQAGLVLMTHASPGQQGYHHVNCRTMEYWEGVMAAVGYRLDWEFTQKCRVRADLNSNPYNHFARSGLAFVRV